MQPPDFVIYLGAFFSALFICVLIHLFIRSRVLLRKNQPGSVSEGLEPATCLPLILNQITLIQTCDHPSAKGRHQTEKLAELLLATRLYFPDSKAHLESFAGRLRGVYEDQGHLLMALADLKKWASSHLA